MSSRVLDPTWGYVVQVVDTYLEGQKKFDLPDDFELPEIPGSRHRIHHLRASCPDTDDGVLQTQGVVLRRRTGGTCDGWHLTAPHPGVVPTTGPERERRRDEDARSDHR